MKAPNHIDLGLAIGAHYSTLGVPKTAAEIAARCNWNPTTKKWASCSRQRIQQIEARAIRKLQRNPQIKEWHDYFTKRNEIHY